MGDSVLKEDLANHSLKVYGCSDKGSVRPHNEDYFGYFIPADNYVKNKWGSLFAVSDGVGGSNAGEVASAETVNVLLQEYYFGDHVEKVPERLKSVFQQTAMHIYDLSICHNSVRNMKCTLSAMLLRQNRFYISHVGDSKIFLIRNKEITQLTKDHSLVGKLVRMGLISREDARVHPNKNILLKAIGDGPLLLPDFYSGYIAPGDVFCLVSDGILEHITEEELLAFLLDMGFTSESLQELITELNKRGGEDNMTIMTVEVSEVPC